MQPRHGNSPVTHCSRSTSMSSSFFLSLGLLVRPHSVSESARSIPCRCRSGDQRISFPILSFAGEYRPMAARLSCLQCHVSAYLRITYCKPGSHVVLTRSPSPNSPKTDVYMSGNMSALLSALQTPAGRMPPSSQVSRGPLQAKVGPRASYQKLPHPMRPANWQRAKMPARARKGVKPVISS
jgi:hypothetical protein